MSKEFEQKVLEFIDISQNNFKKLDNKIDTLESKMNNKIDTLESKMNNKIDALESKMNNKINALESKMNNKIDALESRMNDRIDTLEITTNDAIANINTTIETLTSSVILIEHKVMTEFPALLEAFDLHLQRHKDYDEKNSYLSSKVEENSIRISVLEDQMKFIKNN